jgi:hypothetical protein
MRYTYGIPVPGTVPVIWKNAPNWYW